MNPIRWSDYAFANLEEREIDRAEVDLTLQSREAVVPGGPAREVYMRRYLDRILEQEMLLRVVVEHAESETVVITAYKTSQLSRYLKGMRP